MTDSEDAVKDYFPGGGLPSYDSHSSAHPGAHPDDVRRTARRRRRGRQLAGVDIGPRIPAGRAEVWAPVCVATVFAYPSIAYLVEQVRDASSTPGEVTSGVATLLLLVVAPLLLAWVLARASLHVNEEMIVQGPTRRRPSIMRWAEMTQIKVRWMGDPRAAHPSFDFMLTFVTARPDGVEERLRVLTSRFPDLSRLFMRISQEVARRPELLDPESHAALTRLFAMRSDRGLRPSGLDGQDQRQHG